jgi:TfoX/Sxy family transcriptional regulator of competence genes
VAHDEELADRVRVELHGLDGVHGVEERRMFGGLAFLVRGAMALAVSGRGGIMVRVQPEDREQLLSLEHVDVLEMRGRPTAGWVRVDAAGLADDRALRSWVARGASVAAGLAEG